MESTMVDRTEVLRLVEEYNKAVVEAQEAMERFLYHLNMAKQTANNGNKYTLTPWATHAYYLRCARASWRTYQAACVMRDLYLNSLAVKPF